jgi:hypothetical protein
LSDYLCARLVLSLQCYSAAGADTLVLKIRKQIKREVAKDYIACKWQLET